MGSRCPGAPVADPMRMPGLRRGDMTNRPRLQSVGGSLSKVRPSESPVRDVLCTITFDLAQQGVNPRSRQRSFP